MPHGSVNIYELRRLFKNENAAGFPSRERLGVSFFFPGVIVRWLKRESTMKQLLFCILDNNQKAETLLRTLSQEGYNGTVMNTIGMHHVLPDVHGHGAAISLASMVDDYPQGNLTLFIIIDEKDLEQLKERIRALTGSFKDIPGGMFVLPLSSVEGIF